MFLICGKVKHRILLCHMPFANLYEMRQFDDNYYILIHL